MLGDSSRAMKDANDPPDAPPPPPAAETRDVYADRPEDYDGTCLRPLGLCELGGCCDSCWYGPDPPRHREKYRGSDA